MYMCIYIYMYIHTVVILVKRLKFSVRLRVYNSTARLSIAVII